MRTIATAVLLAVTWPSLASHGQNLTIAAPSGPFEDLVLALEATHQASGQPLYAPPDYTSFLFEWNGADATGAQLTMNYAGPKGGSFTELLFREVPNVLGFRMNSTVDVGFIDNESVDANRFSVWEVDSNLQNPTNELVLWTYTGQGAVQTPPPDALSLIPSGPGLLPLYITFYQQNAFTSTSSWEEDGVRFRRYEAIVREGDFVTRYKLLRSADRAAVDDGDYDDGIFLITSGPEFNPVPEPSTIGLLAVGFLGAFWLRRRRRRG